MAKNSKSKRAPQDNAEFADEISVKNISKPSKGASEKANK
ncbi:MAG: hypothetical protein K0Q90_362 [Paenibacillaceae bacterium]|nr:hypothetical protein [Paenibacillaceae bacterium]